MRELWYSSLAGPTRLELATSGLTEQSLLAVCHYILRDLFNIEAESIISVEGKKNCYKPLFQISHYDKDGKSRHGYQHSNNVKKPSEGVFTMPENDDGYVFEEQ